MSDNVTILITGAGRGIGRGLVAAYLARRGNTVIASVRDPAADGARSLSALPKGPDSTLILLPLDYNSVASISGAIGSLQADHGINSLDIVISNAGICSTFSALAEGEQVVTALEEHVEVNTYGMLRLFHNTLPLLRKSKVDEPKFAYISSPVGALNLVERIGKAPAGIYGASKAFANYIVRRLAIENDDVTTWSISPGLVDTDMSATAIPIMAPPGLKAIPVQESAAGIMKVVAEATHEQTNGHFINYDGAEVPW